MVGVAAVTKGIARDSWASCSLNEESTELQIRCIEPGVVMNVSVRHRSAVRIPLRIVAALAIALSLMAGVSPARAAAKATPG